MWEQLAIAALELMALCAGLWGFARRKGNETGRALAACGLQVVEEGPPLRARAGPMEVRIGDAESGDSYLQVAIAAPDFSEVRILHREATHPLQYSWKPEIATGDVRFDRAFCVEGPPFLVFAVLDARTRALLLGLLTRSWVDLSGGELRAVASPWSLSFTLPPLLEVGRRLTQPLDLVRCLAENAHRDPEAVVRIQNLTVLARELPGSPATRDALRAACSDPSIEVRLRAVQELGAEGLPFLLEFAESRITDGLSAGAVAILGRELPFERLQAILDHALSGYRIQTVRACLDVLTHRGQAEVVGVLARVMPQARGDLAVTVAKALEATGSPEAEPPLIQALQGDFIGLRMAAAEALGRIGSVAAVLPLQEAEENAGPYGELQRAARQAIAAIQARIPGASPGQLSLAGTEAGQLSLAQTGAGQLSLASEPVGQLSLPGETEG
ncbi:MAG TPA: HEAT repeat domain-containing protein [Thermoanaerobaculia bacterium]|nr:HEAT repeat domain-containing protein [Thermoanaerobaculia bacterium]